VANILSQDEVDALLNSFGDDEEESATPEAVAEEPEEKQTERSITIYDFRRPNRISKDQLRFLESLHESFMTRLSGMYSSYFRTMVELKVISVEQLTYGEWVQSLPESTCVFPFSMEPLQGSGAFEMNPALGLAMVDRLLGGQGAAMDRLRDMTTLETTIVKRMIEQSLDELTGVWADMMVFEPKIEGFEKQPSMLKLLPDPETVVLVSFELTTQTINGTLSLCYPFVALEAAVAKMSSGAYASHSIRRRKIPEAKTWLTRGIDEGLLPVNVRLGDGAVSIRDFIRLTDGDIIRLSTKVDQPVRIDVGGEEKFYGRPGRSGRKLAVQILGKTSDLEEKDAPAEAEAVTVEAGISEGGEADV
jgi:flagellar motor switch protein FliM